MSKKSCPKITESELKRIQNDLNNQVSELSKQVAPLYKVLNWKWGGDTVPNKEKIESKLNYLINELEPDHSRYFVQTRGLKAEYYLESSNPTLWDGEINFHKSKLTGTRRKDHEKR